jgi:hypothetical protein
MTDKSSVPTLYEWLGGIDAPKTVSRAQLPAGGATGFRRADAALGMGRGQRSVSALRPAVRLLSNGAA